VPELPEVETMRRLVERHLAGKSVTGQVLTLHKLLRDSPLPSLEPIVGRSVLGARRRAKILVIDLSGNLSLMLHFKLAGQLAIVLPDGVRAVAGHPVPKPDGEYPHKATHWTVTFDEGTVAYYSDIRQFGWIRLLPTEDVAEVLTGFSFGPEAVGPAGIALDDLTARLQRRSIPIKQALLDQGVLAGLGNIYVDEALHAAKIHPVRPANGLTPDEIARLHPAISWALEQGIAQGGAKIIHSRAYPIDGFPAVHAREGESCATCGSTIVKTRVGGRGTYFCPTCQPIP
jgi:formamidopyrimidine-DNA glycosylase